MEENKKIIFHLLGRYPDPLIKAQDCCKVDIASGKITDYIKFESGNVCMVRPILLSRH